MLEGRNFDERDQEKSTPVALIDAGLAQSQWRGQSPIGKRFSFGDENWIEVAGVVGTVKNEGLDAGSQGQVYLPQTQNTQSQLYAVLSVATESGNWRNTIAAAVHSLDPAMPIDDVKTMEQRVALSIAPRKHVSTLLGVFGAVGLLLAAFGLYGLISYLAGQRTREFAVRLALGAQRQDVMRLVLGQGALLVAAGLGIGVAAALGLTRVIQQQLFGVEPTDWRVFLASMVILAAIALAATVVPARRATRVDPIVALRSE